MNPMKIFALEAGLCVEADGVHYSLPLAFDLNELFTSAAPAARLHAAIPTGRRLPNAARSTRPLIQSQEVWAAGVTYYRSRTARIAESTDAGGGRFYDKVYDAERPELFFKASAHRVVAPQGFVRIRTDSRWNVPEPELTLALNSAGKIFGYTIGNDMSSRDIEGENPLYLPQAKVYDGCASLGPCLVINDELPGGETVINLEIRREGLPVFCGETALDQIKRPLASLAAWLFSNNAFPHGCYLMTGTGIIPPDAFTLYPGDEINISISGIGTLTNTVAWN